MPSGWEKLEAVWQTVVQAAPPLSRTQSVQAVGSFQGQQVDLLNGKAAFSNPGSHDLLQGSKGQREGGGDELVTDVCM